MQVEVPGEGGNVTLVQEATRADEAEPPEVTVVVKVTVKPPRLATERLSVVEPPTAKLSVDEVWVKAKSATGAVACTLTRADVWERVPNVALTSKR